MVKFTLHHVDVVKEFSKNVPKKSHYSDVLKDAKELGFVNVYITEPYYWKEEDIWVEFHIEIESMFGADLISCSLAYSQEYTTGEYLCIPFRPFYFQK